MTEQKMERLAEKRALYDGLMKNLRPEKHAERIEKLRAKKEEQLTQVQVEIRTEQKSKTDAIKAKTEAKKKELLKIKEQKMEKM